MAKPELFKDKWGEEIPVLAPGSNLTLTAGAASTGGALPSECFVVRVAAVNDCYIAFGVGSLPTASGTSIFFPKGSELFRVPVGTTHIACIQHTTGGVVSVTCME